MSRSVEFSLIPPRSIAILSQIRGCDWVWNAFVIRRGDSSPEFLLNPGYPATVPSEDQLHSFMLVVHSARFEILAESMTDGDVVAFIWALDPNKGMNGYTAAHVARTIGNLRRLEREYNEAYKQYEKLRNPDT